MANVFFITYEGPARNGNSYCPYKAIAHTADEAIAVINTWKTYGRKTSTQPSDCITVNERTAEKIHELFRDGLGVYYNNKPRDYYSVKTTGCGAWSIYFRHALADTLEEHNRIQEEREALEAEERKKRHEHYVQKRLSELNEQKRGWYHASLEIRLYVFNNHGNDFIRDTEYNCDLIADSGMDAYGKVVEWVRKHPEEVVVNGNVACLQSFCEPTDMGFSFTFLGVKTDEGYSVEKWEEWKKNGEI